jgi:hypothetical protein
LSSTAPETQEVYLNRTQQTEQGAHLWRFIRWTLTPESGTDNWIFCGRVTVVLK